MFDSISAQPVCLQVLVDSESQLLSHVAPAFSDGRVAMPLRTATCLVY